MGGRGQSWRPTPVTEWTEACLVRGPTDHLSMSGWRSRGHPFPRCPKGHTSWERTLPPLPFIKINHQTHGIKNNGVLWSLIAFALCHPDLHPSTWGTHPSSNVCAQEGHTDGVAAAATTRSIPCPPSDRLPPHVPCTSPCSDRVNRGMAQTWGLGGQRRCACRGLPTAAWSSGQYGQRVKTQVSEWETMQHGHVPWIHIQKASLPVVYTNWGNECVRGQECMAAARVLRLMVGTRSKQSRPQKSGAGRRRKWALTRLGKQLAIFLSTAVRRGCRCLERVAI